MITIDVVYYVVGAMFAAFALLGAFDRENPKAIHNTVFWGLLAVSMLAGGWLPDIVNGLLVVAIVAADSEGVRAQRLRLGHFLSTPAVVYEADIVMIMNEEYNILDQHHIAYNPHNADQMRQNVVLSLEKNRAGSDLVDLEFRKQLQFCCFRPDARRVKESLI